jgi:hypothetical protein
VNGKLEAYKPPKSSIKVLLRNPNKETETLEVKLDKKGNPIINYTALEPGEYILEVRVSFFFPSSLPTSPRECLSLIY